MCGEKQRNKTNKQTLDDEFHGGGGGFSLQPFFVCCMFTTIEKYARHTWSLFGAKIGKSHHLGSKEAANVNFSRDVCIIWGGGFDQPFKSGSIF